jgi:hypothetical protein
MIHHERLRLQEPVRVTATTPFFTTSEGGLALILHEYHVSP